jgi:hypothetical protein
MVSRVLPRSILLLLFLDKMKTSALIALVVSATDIATAIKYVSAPLGWAQSVGYNTTQYEPQGGPMPEVVLRAAAPKRQELKTRNAHIANSKTVKIRYGPYTVPGAKTYAILNLSSSYNRPQLTLFF